MTEKEYKEMIIAQSDNVKTKEDLLNLLDKIMEYKHDYGTIVMGCFGAMNGAFNVINNSSSGGITGFQASCLSYELFQKFSSIKPPYKILDFNSMLYPQYEDRFQKKISKETFEYLQNKAKEFLNDDHSLTHTDVIAHWKKIAEGEIPFGWSIGTNDD